MDRDNTAVLDRSLQGVKSTSIQHRLPSKTQPSRAFTVTNYVSSIIGVNAQSQSGFREPNGSPRPIARNEILSGAIIRLVSRPVELACCNAEQRFVRDDYVEIFAVRASSVIRTNTAVHMIAIR